MKHANILIVDDSHTALFDLQLTLDGEVCRDNLYLTSSYHDAVEVLESTSIDLAIVDLQMPTWNGADLIVFIRSVDQLKDLPIVVVTATGEASIIKKVCEDQVQAYLHKPVSKEELVQAIKNCLVTHE